MLQIISGRFFDGGRVNERDCDAVLFSNFSWVGPITTTVAELRPVEFGQSDVVAYVVRYTSRYQPREKDILVHPVAGPAIEQLRVLTSFWLKSLFHEDRNYIEHLCRVVPRHSTNREIIPRDFVPDFFERKRGTGDGIRDFISFLSTVLGIPRKQYKVFVACVEMFMDALQALDTNFDLSYSMFVYVLEALSKEANAYEPVWSDYDENLRTRLDTVLDALEPTTADEIQAILLDGVQLKLTSRFVNFIKTHLDDTFFIEEARNVSRPLPKSDLDRALRNLYKTRSGFVHQLRRVHDQLRIPQLNESSDIFVWNHEPYLTMAGLVRLAHHVLCQFARRQPFLEKEDYPEWRHELPGIIEAQMAPQYWIWQSEGFTPTMAKRRLNGLLEYVVRTLKDQHKTLPNMQAVMEAIERLLGQSSEDDRTALLAIYFVYNAIIEDACKRPGYEQHLQQYENEFVRCSVEMMAARLVTGNSVDWASEECAAVFDRYLKQKYKPRSLNLPRRLEIAIAAEIANLYLESAEVECYAKWIDHAILDAAGDDALQRYLSECRDTSVRLETREILGIEPATTEPESNRGTSSCKVE